MSSKDVIRSKQLEVTFITELDIKTKTPMSANKVTTSLINYIILSQDLHIKKILGETLYDKLYNEWIASTYTPHLLPDGAGGGNAPIIVGDTINYQALYQKVKTPLIWWSYVLSLPNIAIRVEEAGIMLNDTDYSESAGMVGLNRLVAEGESVARSYTEQLKGYLCDTFPNDTTFNTESKDVGGISIGIFTPKRPWQNRRKCTNC